MLTFAVVTKISIKKLKEKMCFLLFFCEDENSHLCCCPNSNANILQKLLTFCVYWVSQLEEPSCQCSQLIDKEKFARLRKLQFFEKQWVL